MAYNAMDYQRLVEEYVNSPAGRKFLKTQKNINVGYTEAEALIIAENLKRDGQTPSISEVVQCEFALWKKYSSISES